MPVQNSSGRPPELEEYASYGNMREKIFWHSVTALPWIGVAFGLGFYSAKWLAIWGICG